MPDTETAGPVPGATAIVGGPGTIGSLSLQRRVLSSWFHLGLASSQQQEQEQARRQSPRAQEQGMDQQDGVRLRQL